MPRQTRSSWGCVQKIGPHDFRLRWTEHHGRESVRKSKTMRGVCKREADAEMRRLYELERIRTEEKREPAPTFAQCWEEWYLPELDKRLSAGEISISTRKNYIAYWKTHISKKWADVPMDEVDITEYQQWLDTKTQSIARLSHITVGNMVNCARLHGVSTITFTEARYKMPKTAKKTCGSELEVYTLTELHSLLDQLHGYPNETVAILCGKGSCRVSEAAAAAVSDFEFLDYDGHFYAVYNLHHQYSRPKDGFIPLKTSDSYRPIVIPEPWSYRLKEIADERKRDGLPYMSDIGYGAPASNIRLNEQWRSFFKDGKTGVRYLPMQKLRNTWATAMLWKYEVPAQMVDKMMGHAAKNILGKNYDRPDKQMFIEAVNKAYFGN